MSRTNQIGARQDVIDVTQVVTAIWRSRVIVASLTFFFAASALVIALVLPNQYRATVTVIPSESTSMSSLSQLARQFGGLASLAGIGIGDDPSSNKSVLAMELLDSWDFLDNFVRDNNLEVAVFAAKGWNRAADELIIDEDVFDLDTGQWVRSFNPDKGETAAPSSWELYDEFRDRVSVSQAPETGIITIGVEFYSPRLASEWAVMLVKSVNERIRVRDRDEARKSIQYLTQQAEQTSLAEMKLVFYQLIQEQTKNLMLTEVSEEYALSTLAPPRIPEEHSWPNRVLICISGTLLGFFLSVIVVFFWRSMPASGSSPQRNRESSET